MYVEGTEEIDDANYAHSHRPESIKSEKNENGIVESTNLFEVTAEYAPAGDQPEAIRRLTEQLQAGNKFSVLQGITGTGNHLFLYQ
jgi:hypothetical protein